MASCARRSDAWSCSCQSFGSRAMRIREYITCSGHQFRRHLGQVVERAHGLDPVAMAGIERHLAVAESPGMLLLRAEPDEAAALELHLGEGPGVGRVVVGAAVADDDDGRPARDGAEIGAG